MDAMVATMHRRIGRGPVNTNKVCKFWLAGTCNRNPCRFMHRESPLPNVYRRTSQQSNALLEEQPRRSSNEGPRNLLALRDASEYKIMLQKSSNHVNKDLPRKRISLKKSLTSISEHVGPEDTYTRESSNSGTKVMKTKTRVFKKRPKNLPVGVAAVDASENKTIGKLSEKACQHWMSGNCVEGDGCQFLHSWFYGDWFSMLAQLRGHTQAICGIALPSGSDKLYSGSTDGTVNVWDCNTGQSTRTIHLGDKIGSLISEGPWIFVGLPNVVKAWNIETAADFSLGDGQISFGQVYAMVVALDMLFAGAQDGSILAWKGSTENPKPFQLAASLKGHTAAVTCLTVGDKRLYSGSMDNTVRVWDLNTLQCVDTLIDHTDAVTSLICWDQYLLSCSLDKTIKVWAATEDCGLKVIYTRDVEHTVIAVCGIPDPENKPILCCSCNDSSVHLYDLPSFDERGRIFSKQEVGRIEIGPGGLFFTGDGTGMLTVWKLVESCGVVSQVAT